MRLAISAEDAWWNNDFGTMADKMRQALEVEILATFPRLRPTKRENDKRMLATCIASAIENNEGNAIASIDSSPGIDEYSKKEVKAKLPGFIKKVVQVRNFFVKESHFTGISRDKTKENKVKAEKIHSQFFGIGCRGMFPFLVGCKKDIKTAK